MKNLVFVSLIAFCTCCGCRNKEEKKDTGIFPALSFIKSQVAHVDTSLYPIIKIVTADSTSDTVYLRREDFRKVAEDFLSLPDLTEKKYKDAYTESRIYDETLNRVILTYLPQKENLEIQRLEVLIDPTQDEKDNVKNLIIDYRISSGDSVVIKKMLWQFNQSFQVVTSVQKESQPEKITAVDVIWNRHETSY